MRALDVWVNLKVGVSRVCMSTEYRVVSHRFVKQREIKDVRN